MYDQLIHIGQLLSVIAELYLYREVSSLDSVLCELMWHKHFFITQPKIANMLLEKLPEFIENDDKYVASIFNWLSTAINN